MEGPTRPRKGRKPKQPVTITQFHPEAYARAVELAGGNRRRVHIAPDGGVLVSNRDQRPRWLR